MFIGVNKKDCTRHKCSIIKRVIQRVLWQVLPGGTLTVVNEVLEDLLAAGLHGVMQQRAARRVLQQDVGRLLVELPELEHKRRCWAAERGPERSVHTHPGQVLRLDAVDQLCI